MKLGVLLPTFAPDAARALEHAARAAEAEIDGVFAYDHLWPMGTPTRPALAPLPVLAAVAAAHPSLAIGPLVARVGLGSVDHLVEGLRTLHALAPGRVIAGLGTGDKLSAAENEAYGLGYPSADERRADLAQAIVALRDDMPVWVGGGSEATHELAFSLGATLNLWNRRPEQIAQAATRGPVNWAGPRPDDLPATLSALREAGATWAIVTPDVEIGELVSWRAGAGG